MAMGVLRGMVECGGELWKISFIQADLLPIEHRQLEALLNVQMTQTKQTLD